jgi:hypothetical protein
MGVTILRVDGVCVDFLYTAPLLTQDSYYYIKEFRESMSIKFAFTMFHEITFNVKLFLYHLHITYLTKFH